MGLVCNFEKNKLHRPSQTHRIQDYEEKEKRNDEIEICGNTNN